MNNKQKEIFIGFWVGVIANTIGTLFYVIVFSDLGIIDTFRAAIDQDHVGSLLALGALLNLLAFFAFLRLRRDHRARGVMIATIFTALIIVYYKLF